MANKNYWSPSQITTFARTVRKNVGEGWKWLTPEVQKAVVESFILGIIRTQDREEVPMEMIDQLYNAMLVEVGLDHV